MGCVGCEARACGNFLCVCVCVCVSRVGVWECVWVREGEIHPLLR